MTTVLVIILWILAILLLVNGCIGIFLLKTSDSKSEQMATVVPNKNTTKKRIIFFIIFTYNYNIIKTIIS